MSKQPLSDAEAALADLVQALRAEGLPLTPVPWLAVPGLDRISEWLVGDDPDQALATPPDWVRAQLERGPGHAAVMGMSGHGLASRRWRCYVATPQLMLAADQPLLALTAAPGSTAAACVATLEWVGRLLRASQGWTGERLGLVASDLHGGLLATAGDWPAPGAHILPDPMVWLEALQALEPLAA